MQLYETLARMTLNAHHLESFKSKLLLAHLFLIAINAIIQAPFCF
jgi:hypothetical protein